MNGPFLNRQIFGGVILLGATVLSFAVGVNPLDDLKGMFGLWALFSISLMVPRRWLARALAVDALALAVLGVYWLLQWKGANDKALSPALGFLFASLCCFAASRIPVPIPDSRLPVPVPTPSAPSPRSPE